MRIAGHEVPAPQSLQRGMFADGFHEELGRPSSAMLRYDEDVRDVGEDGVIRDHAGESNQTRPLVNAET